jgi:hypothetical protein
MKSQMILPLTTKLPKHAYDYGNRSSGETHGVVLTKPHIVELILDLAGYVADRDLTSVVLLEPSCGHGAFLLPAVTRLLDAAKRVGRSPATLEKSILAFDIEGEHVKRTRTALRDLLKSYDVNEVTAAHLVASWVKEDDFLLAPLDRSFDVVIGNPPYVRIEQLSPALQSEYRRRYRSLYDRADLYVAFIERGLASLSPSGVLSFICADRWVSNKYGAPLRELVSASFKLCCYVDLHKASPFESEVIAYPSIFVMSPGKTDSVPVVTLETGSEEECRAVTSALQEATRTLPSGVSIATYNTWFDGADPWVLSSPSHLATLRALEAKFAPLEAAAHVGIGVATGNDKLYIVESDVDIEPARLVPLVMREHIKEGAIANAGRFVINAFETNGGVVNLDEYPRLRKYLARHAAEIKKRHVAQKNPASWFRTIDRVYPHLVAVPKLLIPDIAGSNEVALDVGHYHPHHNLYFVTSDAWDMEVLGGLLSSTVALFFVWSYAVKMRGGYLRFQAQYLRRIRLPDPTALPVKLSKAIKAAFRARDFARLDKLAIEAYELDGLPPFDFVDTRRK